MQLYVEGRISGRAYQTDSGETRASLDVNAFEVQIFNDPQSQQSNNQPNPSNFSQPTSISEQPAAQQEPTAQQESAPQQEPTPQQEPEKKDDQLPW